MRIRAGQASAFTVRTDPLFAIVASRYCLWWSPRTTGPIGDEQGAASRSNGLPRSPALMAPGDAAHQRDGTPGFRSCHWVYALEIEMPGFATCTTRTSDCGGRDDGENGDAEACGCRGVDRGRGTGSRIDARNPGFGSASFETSTRFQRGGRACSISQGRSRRVAHLAVKRHGDRRSPRSAPAPTKTSFSSTA
jgi:hypothetical protein